MIGSAWLLSLRRADPLPQQQHCDIYCTLDVRVKGRNAPFHQQVLSRFWIFLPLIMCVWHWTPYLSCCPGDASFVSAISPEWRRYLWYQTGTAQRLPDSYLNFQNRISFPTRRKGLGTNGIREPHVSCLGGARNSRTILGMICWN